MSELERLSQGASRGVACSCGPSSCEDRRRRRKLDVQEVNAALSLDVLPVREVTPLGWAGRRFGVTSA